MEDPEYIDLGVKNPPTEDINPMLVYSEINFTDFSRISRQLKVYQIESKYHCQLMIALFSNGLKLGGT